ncbi:MAG: replicative DNA helicase [Proteobacteria bacterium SW_6_67_9]|jgi:replicative DNA helicase|nr:MAG: replicative DNA helicase [Proteobacteria bacterium SW_6_67_9]
MSDNVSSLNPQSSAADPRMPPHSIEAEQAVLGGLMLANDAWDRVADRVHEEDFYRREHRLLYRAIGELADRDQPRDVVTVSEWLGQRGELDSVGNLAYLARLAEETPSAANITAYADIVRERSVLRQLSGVGEDIATAAYNPQGRESKELLDYAEAQVFAIADQGSRHQRGFQPINRVLTTTLDHIDTLLNSDSEITGLATGFHEFDDMTSGLQRSDLIIIAGRPSMGKTAFAMNLAEHVAMTGDEPVAVFSMEMPAEQIATRMISSLGRVELQKLRSGKLDEADWPRINSAVSLLSQQSKLFIDDTPGLTPSELRARARRLKREHGLSLIFIDYIQLMQMGTSAENRATELSEISRSLKGLAKELDVPVVCLSQLNRSLEQRGDKRPVMSDLRESGAIEQDADVIVFIYRDEVYDEDSPQKGTAEILVRKQRNGPTGTVRVTFLGQYTRFENFSPEVYGN